MKDLTDDFNFAVLEHGISYTTVGYLPEECIGQYRQLRRQLRIREDSTVLDVGCGLGFGFSELRCGSGYSGIDKSEMMINGARLLHDGRIEVEQADFNDISLKDGVGPFDFIVMSGIFNVGVEWAEIARLVRKAWEMCSHGVGVAFQRQKSDDPSFTIYPVTKWLKLFHALSTHVTYDASWSELNAVITARRESWP